MSYVTALRKERDLPSYDELMDVACDSFGAFVPNGQKKNIDQLLAEAGRGIESGVDGLHLMDNDNDVSASVYWHHLNHCVALAYLGVPGAKEEAKSLESSLAVNLMENEYAFDGLVDHMLGQMNKELGHRNEVSVTPY